MDTPTTPSAAKVHFLKTEYKDRARAKATGAKWHESVEHWVFLGDAPPEGFTADPQYDLQPANRLLLALTGRDVELAKQLIVSVHKVEGYAEGSVLIDGATAVPLAAIGRAAAASGDIPTLTYIHKQIHTECLLAPEVLESAAASNEPAAVEYILTLHEAHQKTLQPYEINNAIGRTIQSTKTNYKAYDRQKAIVQLLSQKGGSGYDVVEDWKNAGQDLNDGDQIAIDIHLSQTQTLEKILSELNAEKEKPASASTTRDHLLAVLRYRKGQPKPLTTEQYLAVAHHLDRENGGLARASYRAYQNDPEIMEAAQNQRGDYRTKRVEGASRRILNSTPATVQTP